MVHVLHILRWIDRYKLPIVLAAVALLIALGSMLYFGELRFYDEQDYTAIAQSLTTTGVYGYGAETPTAFRPPGYVFFLSAILLLFNTVTAAQVIQCILWGASALLAATLAARLQGKEAAGIALVFCLFYPTFAFAATTLYPQTLVATTMLALLVVMLRPGAGKLNNGEMGAMGFGLSLLLLTNPLTLPLILMAGPILIWIRRAPRWQAGLLVLIPVGLLALWMVRNHMVMGADFTVATNLGFNLLLGNSEFAAPNLGTTTDVAAYRAQAAGLGEVAENTFYKHAAMEWIKAHPGQAVALYAAKFLNYFNYANTLATAGETSGLREIALFISYYTVLALVALRLLWMGRRPLSRSEVVLLLIYLGAGLAYSVFFNRIRFRIPFDYLAIVIASGWLGHMVKTLSDRTKPN